MSENANNVVLNNSLIVTEPLYAQPHALGKIFGLSRTTVWRFITEMESCAEYKNASISLNNRLKLIKIKDFEKFLQSQHKQWLTPPMAYR